MARKRLGEVLIEDGLIDERELQEALRYKEKSGYRLGTALVAMRVIAEWQLAEALGKALEMEVVDLSRVRPHKSALARIPQRLAERFDLVPLRLEGRGDDRRLVVAMSDPLNRAVVRRMREVAGCSIHPVLAGLSSIQRAIRESYHGSTSSRTLKGAERYSAQARESGRQRSRASASEDALRAALAEVRRLGSSKPPASPGGQLGLEHRILGLELKVRALIHVLLKHRVVSEKDYVKALKHIQEADRDRGVSR